MKLGTFWPERPERVRGFLDSFKVLNSFIYVCCWHVNFHESAAMWKEYASRGSGIAIQSTFAGLKEALTEASQEVNAGLVKYLAYERDSIEGQGGFGPVMTKRMSFDFERELRAVMMEPDAGQNGVAGVLAQVDLAALIDAVHMAPGTGEWERDLLSELIVKYGYNWTPRQSSIDAAPLY